MVPGEPYVLRRITQMLSAFEASPSAPGLALGPCGLWYPHYGSEATFKQEPLAFTTPAQRDLGAK